MPHAPLTRRAFAFRALASCSFVATACMPELHVRPAERLTEGEVKLLAASVKPSFCDYTRPTSEFRPGGTATWSAAGATVVGPPDPGFHAYRADAPGSGGAAAGDPFDVQWTMVVPRGSNPIYQLFCGSKPTTFIRTGTFAVGRAFDLVVTPSPLQLPAGVTRTLTLQAERYGSFSGPITVTPGPLPAGVTSGASTVTIAGASATLQLNAALDLAPASHALSLAATSPGMTGGSYPAQVEVVSPFTLSASPSPVELPINGSASLAIGVSRVSGFTGPVTVRLSGLPAGVSAAPASLAIGGASGTFTLSAATGATPGVTTILLSGTAATATQATRGITLNLGRPSVAAVSPSSGPRGSTVTITGSGFNPVCALNTVAFGSITVAPASCATSLTSLTVVVPGNAPFGSSPITVTSAGMESPPVAFRVNRQPGNFTNAGSTIGLTSRTCATGRYSVTIAGGPAIYTATYRRVSDNATVWTESFDRDSESFEDPGGADWDVSVNGAGEAGFASCTTGVVIDMKHAACPRRMAVKLRDLDRAASFAISPYCFFAYSGDPPGVEGPAFLMPRVYHSPDGSLIALAVASPLGAQIRLELVDQAGGGNRFRTVELTGIGGSTVLSVTSDNRVAVTHGGTSYGPFAIP